MPEELKVCPFCGREALGPTKHKGTFGFMCSHCGCRVDRYEFASDARGAWNRRTSSISEPSQTEAAFREALEAVTPMFEKLMMSCGPFKEDIQILQMCVAALASSPAPKAEPAP